MQLKSPVTIIPGVGDAYQKKLQNLNISTVSDLINHFPSRYIDYQNLTPIGKIKPNQDVCIKAQIESVISSQTKGRLTIQTALVKDSSGPIKITWFNQPYLTNTLKKGEIYYFTGKTKTYRGRLTINSPQFEQEKKIQLHSQRLVPVYPQTEGVSSKWLRNKIHIVLNNKNIKLPDPLSKNILDKYSLQPLNKSYHNIHFPKDKSAVDKSQDRLAFNDLLSIFLKSELTKKQWKSHTSRSVSIDKDKHQKLLDSLPFQLTQAQQDAIKQLFKSISHKYPTSTLLQGDVGSGKTIVALSAVLQTLLNEKQVIIMAPTQVLAQQHQHTFSQILKPFGINPKLVTGDTNIKQPHSLLIGTHALLHRPETINHKKLGLIVIDEQHRFGVLQRSQYLKKDPIPHVITISATPIPRSLALSIYGHVQIAPLKQLPKERKPIKTWLVDQEKRKDALSWIKEEIKETGNQAFIVCPLIKLSKARGFKNVKAATVQYEKLKNNYFSDLKLELLHGKLNSKEKNKIIVDFKNQKSDILVTTPVIEVGIDIKSTTIIMIENAERFGLAQLHQLRGRVGRDNKQAYCILISNDTEQKERLNHLTKTNDGFKLAKIDLKLRGSGELFGTSQTGHIDTQFNAFWDKSLNDNAKDLAKTLIKKQKALSILKQLNRQLAKFLPGD